MVYILIIHRAFMMNSIDSKNFPSVNWKIEKLESDEQTQILIRSLDGPELMLLNSEAGYNYVNRLGDCWVRLELTTKLPNESFGYTEEEYLKLNKLSNSLEATFVKYSDLHTLREVLNLLSQQLEFYIDNDFGTLLLNSEFMELWNNNLTWDWSKDL
jgi:hypothetical protein